VESVDLLAILTVAFLGSIGHCSGMCGGFVVAYTSAKIDTALSQTAQSLRHTLYNSGRISAYVIIGALFGALGSTFKFDQTAQGILYAFIALLMVLIGYSLMGKSRFLHRLEGLVPFQGVIKHYFQSLLKTQSLSSFYLIGLLNGFIPCGFVYFFAISAAATASITGGAFVMLIFGLATLPVMFGLGFMVGVLQKYNLRGYTLNFAAWVVILYGFWMGYKAYLFLFTAAPACH